MHEFDLIRKYFSNLSKLNKYSLDLNDDVFFDKKKSLVVSIDTYNQGTHFVNFKNPDLVIKKIIRSSISDLICKGVLPKYYFISGSGNKKTFHISHTTFTPVGKLILNIRMILNFFYSFKYFSKNFKKLYIINKISSMLLSTVKVTYTRINTYD